MLKYLVLLATLFLVSCAREPTDKSSEGIGCDNWSLAEGQYEESVLVIRFRDCDLSSLRSKKFPKRFQVTWVYEHNGSGMPSSKLSQEMAVFENRLVEALEESSQGVLAAVITTDGYRQWVYYSVNIKVFGGALTNIPQEEEPYPINIEASDDVNWEYFKNEILSAIQQS